MGPAKNNIKQFAIRALLFSIIFLIIDLIIGEIVSFSYFSQENKYSYGINKTTDDIIIVGSSRAVHHYIPSIISDTLGLKCFNIGSGGQTIYYDYAIIGSLLERYTPKLIILDINYSEFIEKKSRNEMDNLSILLPFYSKSKTIKEIIDMRGPSEKVKMISRIYPFNSQITEIFYSFVMDKNNPNIMLDGYIPMFGEITEPLKVMKEDPTSKVDTVKIRYLSKIISLCQKKDAKLILINSPSFGFFIKETTAYNILINIAGNYDIDIWDYSNNARYLKPEYFIDINHMNDYGAREFSKEISNRIKNETEFIL